MNVMKTLFTRQFRRQIQYVIQIVVLLGPLTFSSVVAANEKDEAYLLGVGDVINVTVYGEPELSVLRQKITLEGGVTFPLIGNLIVKGLTVQQLGVQLTEKYKEGFLKRPTITVSIAEYRPYYVNGEVRRPGAYPYIEGLTIRKAIMIAGGMSERGTESKLKLLAENSKESKSVDDIDAPLRAGDIVIVGASLF